MTGALEANAPSTELPAPDASRAAAYDALCGRFAALAYCRYLRSAPGGHVFRGRLPVRSPLVFAPLVGALASLPWLCAAPPTTLQAAVSLILAGLCAALVWMGWPRIRLLVISDDLRTLRSGRIHIGLAALPRIRLGASLPRTAPQCQYQVHLVDGCSGREVSVLKGPRPDVVAIDLHRWLGAEARPLTGWGLSSNVRPWSYHEPSGHPSLPPPSPGAVPSSTISALRTDVRVANVMTVATAIVVAIQLWLWLSSRSNSTTWLSAALPLAFSAYLVFVAGACRARTLYQRRGDQFRLRTGFPPRYGPWQRVSDMVDVSVVGSREGAGVCHVLISMNRGIPVAGRVRAEGAEEFRRRVQRDAQLPPLPLESDSADADHRTSASRMPGD